MKKIFKVLLLLVLFFSTGCKTVVDENQKVHDDFDEKKFRKESGKNRIQNDTITYSNYFSNPETAKLKMYNSIEESVKNQPGISSYGYNGQKIEEMIHIFSFKDGMTRIIFLARDDQTNEMMIYADDLYYNNKTKKYSNILGSRNPLSLEEDRGITVDANNSSLWIQKSNNKVIITLKNEPNTYYGITTDLKELKKLKIEKQEPDGIKSFKCNKKKFYFWYYDD
ncbi:MAG: hypothetical protein RR585_04555, partial [Coprobacillus sp.]